MGFVHITTYGSLTFPTDLHEERGHHADLDARQFRVGQLRHFPAVNKQLVIVVHFDVLAVDVDGQRFCAGRLSVSAVNVVDDDIEVFVVDEVVGASAHEVKAAAIEGQIVRITCRGTSDLALLVGARPFSTFTGAETKIISFWRDYCGGTDKT